MLKVVTPNTTITLNYDCPCCEGYYSEVFVPGVYYTCQLVHRDLVFITGSTRTFQITEKRLDDDFSVVEKADETKPAPPTFKRGQPGTLIDDEVEVDLNDEDESEDE